MKKLVAALTFLLAVGIFSTKTATSSGNTFTFTSASEGDYYANVKTDTASSLYNSLHGIINSGWKQFSYNSLDTNLPKIDYDSEGIDDPNNTNRIVDIYSLVSKYKSSQSCGNYSKEGDCWNKEHLIPKSWWGGSESGSNGEGGDAFNMYPTDGKNNGMRSNYPFGEVTSSIYTGQLDAIKVGISSYPGYNGTVCEINDKYKGDVARAYFYFVTKHTNYSTYTQGNGKYVFTETNKENNFGLTEYAKNLFIKWHYLDPVSDWEKERCDRVYNIQNNRNPFIDHPEYVNMIWGTGIEINPEKVTLNTYAKSLNISSTYTLSATISPSNTTNKTVTWVSSNPSVASVDHGNITALSNGTTTITCKTANGIEARCVIVVGSPIVEPSRVELDTTSHAMKVGEAITLNPTVFPENSTNKDVVFTSSDDEAVYINGNEILALTRGDVTITCTTLSGKVTAECKLTISEVIIYPVTSISLNKTTLELKTGENETLISTISPSNATNKKVTWESSDSTVASVNNGTVNAHKAGSCIITVTTEDGNKKATCTVTIINSSVVTGVSLNVHEITIEVNSQVTLTATITPSTATDKSLTWVSISPTIASVNENGLVTGLKEGTTYVSVSTNDGGYSDICKVTVGNKNINEGTPSSPIVAIVSGSVAGGALLFAGLMFFVKRRHI